MLGFSIYLNADLTKKQILEMELMSNSGFKGVFSSVNIPEDDSKKYIVRLKKLGKLCHKLNLNLTIDITEKGLKSIDIDVNNIKEVAKLGVTSLRIDDGFNMHQVAEMSRDIPLALNASTITETDITKLHHYKANFDNLEAWHNYYPHPDTGLSSTWLKNKNDWLKGQGFTTMAFVAGDTELRGPIYAGLPTLEDDRKQHPLAATLKLLRTLSVDKVYVGDPSLSDNVREQFRLFFKQNILQLSIQSDMSMLLTNCWHSRPDLSQNVVRLVEGRDKIKNVLPFKTNNRPVGSITVDNSLYGRYTGELEITKKALNADTRVNVVGKVIEKDLPLLSWVDSNQAIQFISED